MGFLDHLFPPDASAAAQPQKDAGEIGRDAIPVSSGTQFLHPKPPPSRLASALRVSPQNRVVPLVSPKPNLNPSPVASLADQPQPRELVLTVGDILPHLPTEAIKPGLHDADALVRFDIGDLSADIARGRAMILLSKLADVCPELVRKPEAESADQAIRLPLQKLVEQLSTVKAAQESVPLDAKPEDLSKGPSEAQETSVRPAPPDPPLVQIHGDIVGHAASPVWLDPIKKNRTEAKPGTSSRPRSRRDELIKPSLPPTPLAKTFAKRKNTVPASSETATTSGTEESAIVMDSEQQRVPATTSTPEELVEEASSAPVEMEAVASEADPTALGTPEHIAPQGQGEVVEGPPDQAEKSAPLLHAVDDEQPAARGSDTHVEISEESITFSQVDEIPVSPDATAADNSGVSEPVPLAYDSASTVTEAPSDAQSAPETSNSDAPSGESLRPPTSNSETAALPPTTLKNETVQMIPTPRIRPPAPPPPVLATPAAGLREAISQSPTGESLSTSPTAHAQGSAGEYRARITWPPADPQAEVAKPWSVSNFAPEAGRDDSQSSSVAPVASGKPATHTSTSASEGAHREVDSLLPPSGSVGVRPPPIQFPTTTFNSSGADLSSAEGGSPEEARNMDSDSAPSIPVVTPPAAPQSVAPPQQSLGNSDVDEQRSSYWSEQSQQLPVKNSLPVSLVDARPAAPVALPSSSMPSRSLALFNQENLQALFMTEELLDVSSLARHVAALPGITACALFAGNEAAQAGEFPPDFALEVLREMGLQFVSSASVFGGRLLGRDVENVTLQGGGFSVTLFARAGLCLCVVHRARGFLPGVREKLAAVADELARGA